MAAKASKVVKGSMFDVTTDKAAADVMKTYVIEQALESFEVVVPASWKTTFGPGVPGEAFDQFGRARRQGSGGGWCLRFYEDKEHQRAFFAGVTGFWDKSIQYSKVVQGNRLPDVAAVGMNDMAAVAHF